MSTLKQNIPERAPDKLNVQEVIGLTARLARLLAEEVDHLSAMQITKIRDLQDEKQFLIASLEGHRKLLARYPHLSETIPSRDRHELEEVVKVFENILKENYRRLKMAREVNHRVVKAVTRALQDTAMSRVYDGSGTTGAMGADSISLTFNQTA